MPITPQSRWKYIGPGGGRGRIHLVTALDIHNKVITGIFTWSLLTAEEMRDDDTGGMTWFGPPALFRQHFRPVHEHLDPLAA